MATLRIFFFRLGHLGFLIASCGASFVYFMNVLTGHPWEYLGTVLSFLTVFVIYNFDHLRDSHGFDQASTPERARYMLRYKGIFRLLIAAAGVGYVVLAAMFRPWALAIGAFFAVSGVLYVIPFLPGKRIRRLKDIPLFKNIYVPACWCILLLYSEAEIREYDTAALLGVVFLFVRMGVGVTTGDIRDLQGDLAAKLKTAAILLGRRKTLGLLQALNGISIAGIIIACFLGYWPLGALAMIGPVLYIVWLLRIIEREPAQGEFVAEIFDFEIISYAPIMLLATMAAR